MFLNMKQTVALAAAITLLSTAPATFAATSGDVYVGGGINFNSFGIGNAIGVQVLGGYEFNQKINNDISSALEVGYMDSGNFDNGTFGRNNDAQGLWVAMVESVPVSNKIDASIRLGVDLGDDDGLMAGAGMAYKFNNQVALRTEYVVRDNINSFQFNVLVRL